MKKLVALTALGFCFATGSAFAASYTGVVTSAMCAAHPAEASKASHAACSRKCLKAGSPMVFLMHDKAYKVNNPKMLEAFAGDRITLDGELHGDMLTVKSVKR